MLDVLRADFRRIPELLALPAPEQPEPEPEEPELVVPEPEVVAEHAPRSRRRTAAPARPVLSLSSRGSAACSSAVIA